MCKTESRRGRARKRLPRRDKTRDRSRSFHDDPGNRKDDPSKVPGVFYRISMRPFSREIRRISITPAGTTTTNFSNNKCQASKLIRAPLCRALGFSKVQVRQIYQIRCTSTIGLGLFRISNISYNSIVSFALTLLITDTFLYVVLYYLLLP